MFVVLGLIGCSGKPGRIATPKVDPDDAAQSAMELYDLDSNTQLDSDELKAAIILFFSLLDEQQRRLYAGLESYKLGRGGDVAISALLGVNVHTISRGRKELFGGEVNRQGVRSAGGGRKRLEKKRRRS